MAKTYKVWIEVEEYDEETGESQQISPSFGVTGTFSTQEEAEEFASKLHGLGEEVL